MSIFSEQEFELFKQTCKVSQKSLMKTLAKFLTKAYGKQNVIITEDYICAEGKIPIAIAAHMDTVHREIPSQIFFDTKEDVIWSPQGLGADDRAGVFAILKLVRDGERPHIILTTDEEKGGLGAYCLSKIPRETIFKQLNFIVEIDRRGSEDSVYYECDNRKFEKFINSFGFITNWGTFTDISELCPAWEVAGVNLSSGYYNEHSCSEYLRSGELLNTINKVKNILHSESKYYKFIPLYDLNSYFAKAYGYYDDDYGYSSSYFKKLSSAKDALYTVSCKCCCNTFLETEVFPTKTLVGSTAFYCPDCVCDHVDWCDNCLEAFEKFETKDDLHLCLDCRKEYANNMSKNKKGVSVL